MFGLDDIAVADIAGPLISGGLSYLGATSANQNRSDIANQANAFSAQQYATRYQTQTKDMMAAGLNPMLSYSQGAGSSPTGQQAQVENPMSSATEAFHQSRQRDLIAAQVRQVDAGTKNTEADTKIKEAQAKLIPQQVVESQSRERQADTSANESTYRLWSQQNVVNPSQKQLQALHWSQMKVNEKTLPLIASEIVRNGAYSAQARALAGKAVADGDLSRAALAGALNEKAFEESVAGRSKRYIDFGVNSAGKISEIVRGNRTNVTNEHGTYYDKFGNPSGGFSRFRSSR